jgi:hypothetical protein
MEKMNRRDFMGAWPALGAASLMADPLAGKPSENAKGLAPAAGGLRAATFSLDVTPPVGSPLEECDPPVATSKDLPLFAKGVVLSDGKTRYVLCVFDYCELRTGAHDLFRRKIANAARVNELHVAVHCVHQHDAPLYDVDAEKIMDLVESPPHVCDLPFLEDASDRVAAAVHDALENFKPFTHVGYGKAKVVKWASNRRVPMPDGSIGVRYSACTDPVLIAAPEGLIDPWLRTVTLFNGERPFARMHYYACHPQSYYGKGHMNPDIPGLARERLEKEEGIPQIYFTGCAGNVAGGKYNNGTPGARVELAGRLYTGMKESVASTQRAAVSEIGWKTNEVKFALKEDPAFSEEYFRKVLADPSKPWHDRSRAVLALAWYDRVKTRPAIDLTYYRLGPVHILHLPGESFIQYQLYAQSIHPDNFLAVAAYGELGTGYICTDAAPKEGGYEPTNSFVGPPSEVRYKAAIREILT